MTPAETRLLTIAAHNVWLLPADDRRGFWEWESNQLSLAILDRRHKLNRDSLRYYLRQECLWRRRHRQAIRDCAEFEVAA